MKNDKLSIDIRGKPRLAEEVGTRTISNKRQLEYSTLLNSNPHENRLHPRIFISSFIKFKFSQWGNWIPIASLLPLFTSSKTEAILVTIPVENLDSSFHKIGEFR